MKKVLEWCEQHKKDPPVTNEDDSDSRKKTTDIDEWDQKFMQVDQEMLFEIILVGPTVLVDGGLSILADMRLTRVLLAGCQLPRHQSSSRRRLQDRRKHDQRQVARGDSKDIQYSE